MAGPQELRDPRPEHLHPISLRPKSPAHSFLPLVGGGTHFGKPDLRGQWPQQSSEGSSTSYRSRKSEEAGRACWDPTHLKALGALLF